MCYQFCSLKDINECSSDPCENGGTCTDEVDGYICDCDCGYTGAECQTGNPTFLHSFNILTPFKAFSIKQNQGCL